VPNKVAYSFVANDKFTAVAKRVGRATDRVRGKFRLLGSAAKATSAKAVAGLVAIKGAAISAMKSGIAPLIAAVASLAGAMKFYKIGTEFQDAMADLSAITGATGEDLAFMRAQSMGLGRDAKIASAEVATAFKLVASAKNELLRDPAALAKITEQMLLLKNATGLELAEATTFGVAALNQFEVGADQAARFVNVLAASAKIGAAEVMDVGEALINAGPVAKIAAISFEETNAAIQVLAKSGQKGALAGTGLRGVLLKLNKAIPFDQVGGFANALEMLKKRTEGLAAGQRLIAMQKIFGEEMVKAGVPLVENVALLREFTAQMTGTSEAGIQAAIRLGTMSSKVRGLGVSIQNFLIRAFDKLAPQIDEHIKKAEAFFDSLKPEDVDAFAAKLRTVMSVLAPIGKMLWNLLKIASVVAAPAAYLLDFVAAKAESLAKFIGGVASGVEKLGGFVESAKEKGWGLGGIKGKVSKLFGGGEEIDVSGVAEVAQTSKMESTVTLRAPKGIVESIKTKTTGAAAGFRMGVNMVEELP